MSELERSLEDARRRLMNGVVSRYETEEIGKRLVIFESAVRADERARVLPAGGDALEAFRAWAKGLPRPPRQPMTPPRKCQWCEKPATTYYDPSVNAAAGTGVGTSFPACDDHSVRFDLMVNFPPARAAFEAGAEWARARVLWPVCEVCGLLEHPLARDGSPFEIHDLSLMATHQFQPRVLGPAADLLEAAHDWRAKRLYWLGSDKDDGEAAYGHATDALAAAIASFDAASPVPGPAPTDEPAPDEDERGQWNAVIVQMQAELERADEALLDALGERDEYHALLDAFARAVAPVEVIGEHSSANDPWANALEILRARGVPGPAEEAK